MATWMDVRLTDDQLKVLVKAAKDYLERFQHQGHHSSDGNYYPIITDAERIALEFFIEMHKEND